MDTQTPPTAPPPRSWWGRNWKWVVPLGCLLPIVTIGGCFAMMIGGVFFFLKSSDAFSDSFDAVVANEDVRAALGEPIEASFFVMGNINVSTSGGHADINYKLTGPKDTAAVYAVADKEEGKWVFSKIVAVVESTGEEIDVLEQSKKEEFADQAI